MLDPDPKIALRRHFRAARRDFVATLSPAAREALEASLAALTHPLIANQAPAAYAARGAEIDPRHFGAEIFPRVTAGELTFHLGPREQLEPGYQGISEPPATARQVTPSLFLIPLLAATPAGHRLGQGGGFYDRALHRLRAAGPVTAIGLAWDLQLTNALPADPWDEPLDYIATPSRLVECARFR